ncbi:menaquinone biosynthesis protein [soil metagenome]
MASAQLAGLRVGAVSYLNTKPLIWGIDASQLVLDVPARLAADFAAGRLDVALQPVFATLNGGGGLLVDDVAIACHGPVFSVIVASQTEFEDCGEIYLDPSSRSSAALLRVLNAEFYGNALRLVEGAEIPPGAARLIIGDPAIRFRHEHGTAWHYHDLGDLWLNHTGLPFVFAAWTLSRQTADPKSVADYLRAVKTAGQAARAEIAAGEEDPAFALHYLTDYIRFDLREEEKKAIDLFGRLAARHGILSAAGAGIRYC